ncbi:MAG: hypothetical protein IPP34_17455 [Bacteroidetes bacterium]|nr:hypothetical protein [Bacteroidota bacterium]
MKEIMPFISKEWFYALCIFLIPLSVGFDLPGGASISFPGELMLAVLAGMVAFQILLKPVNYKKILVAPTFSFAIGRIYLDAHFISIQ